jgi:hypothetical protein
MNEPFTGDPALDEVGSAAVASPPRPAGVGTR